MRKLKLDLDSLDVQSFQTDDGLMSGGTVQGQSGVWDLPSICTYQCGPSTYYGCGYTDYETCGNTCNTCDQYTCFESCGGSCFTCVDDTCQC